MARSEQYLNKFAGSQAIPLLRHLDLALQKYVQETKNFVAENSPFHGNRQQFRAQQSRQIQQRVNRGLHQTESLIRLPQPIESTLQGILQVLLTIDRYQVTCF